MRNTNPIFGANLTFASAALAIIAFAGIASGQQAQPIREDFELQIANETITESNFRRQLNLFVAAGNAQVQAGAAVSAGRITVRLANVTGRVRFFANPAALSALQRLRGGQ